MNNSSPSDLPVSIMITSHNRREDLRLTLTILGKLDPMPIEVLIYADGCNDRTAEMIRREYPWCKLLEHDQRQGSIVCRDEMLRSASGAIVLSLDDDSAPIDQNAIRLIQKAFEEHPAAAVISLHEISDSPVGNKEVITSAGGHDVATYSSCAAAIRRNVYFQLGGYQVFFRHAYEEPDYALRCYAAGFHVWFEPSIAVRHRMSATNRDTLGTHYLHARNELWSVLMRCPFPQLVVVALFRVWRQFRFIWRYHASWALRQPVWWLAAFAGIGQCLAARAPIKWSIYYNWMKLSRSAAGKVQNSVR